MMMWLFGLLDFQVLENQPSQMELQIVSANGASFH
jgi:hypothetical protein